jgi:predicted PurR-regulated permease PerM
MLLYTLIAISCISLLFSLVLFWYTRSLIEYITLFTDDSKEVARSLQDYHDHLKNVYNMDLFYGDATLESLLEHTKNVTEELDAFVSTTEQIIVEDNNE